MAATVTINGVEMDGDLFRGTGMTVGRERGHAWTGRRRVGPGRMAPMQPTIEAAVEDARRAFATGEYAAIVVGPWLIDDAGERLCIEVAVHWVGGIAVGEFLEDGRTVYVPAFANGCLDMMSIRETPRFTSLDEVRLAVAAHLAAYKAAQAEAREREERERQVRASAAAARPAPEMVVADCGHEVARGLLMHASLGSTCPDCYDDWS